MTSFLLFMLVFHTCLVERIEECHKFCRCKPTGAALCKGQLLNYIPRFPEYIYSVTMEYTNFSTIGEFGFSNLTFHHINSLNLTGNNITFIHPNAFVNVTGLKRFTISREKNLNLTEFVESLKKMNKSVLQRVFFTKNGWTDLPRDMFNSFTGSSVRYLHLEGNYLANVDCSIFSPLENLGTLELSWNQIERVTVNGIRHIKLLLLDHNKLMSVPRWCGSNTSSFVPYLYKLELSYNLITDIDVSDLQCLPKVKSLGLNGLNLNRIKNNMVANMPSLEGLYIGNGKSYLSIIEDLAFNSSSLKNLSLVKTQFSFHGKFYSPQKIFSFCPKLTKLDLTGNSLRNLEEKLGLMLEPLNNLRSLKLAKTRMSRLPRNVFTKLHALKKLDLEGNKLDNWNESDRIFGNVSITSLNLRSNSITFLNKTSFSNNLWDSLRTLNLAINPFSCTCDQMWFLNWINSTNITLAEYPRSYKCNSPNSMKGVLLKDYRPTEENCTPRSPWFTVIITISSSVVFLLGLIFLLLKCQTNIKNRLYLFRVFFNRRKEYSRLENSEDFEYHAFVVYCDADRTWVHDKFLRKMENEEGMHLCVHHRDFDVGETIVGNIDKYLQKSWKVVVIMSNNFAKSEWCQWECDVVQERRRRHGRDIFLLIMLKNIDSKHMTCQLRMLLDSTPYLIYQNGIGEKLFWKAAVETLRKPLGHPPVSVL